MYVEGSSFALRARAQRLDSARYYLSKQTPNLRDLLSRRADAGQGEFVEAFSRGTIDAIGRTETLAHQLGKAADILAGLASTLEALEKEAQNDPRLYEEPGLFDLGRFEYQAAIDYYDGKAYQERLAATAALRAVKESLPTYRDHYGEAAQSYLAETAGLVGGFIKDSVVGLYDAAKFVVWDGTLQYLVDSGAANEAWTGLGSGVAAIIANPEETGRAVFSLDIRDQNTTAWLIVLPLSLIGTKGTGSMGPLLSGANAAKYIPGGSLNKHEGRTSPGGTSGHTIQRHIGMNDAELKQRADKEFLRMVSTFRSAGEANRAVGSALKAANGDIEKFLRSPAPSTRVEVTLDKPIGRVYSRATGSFSSGSTVMMKIVKDPHMPEGFRIVTAMVK